MNKKQVLSNLINLANALDDKGDISSANILTEVGKRLAQSYDDDYGDFDYNDSDRQSEMDGLDDYNRHEENELMRDQWLENQDDIGGQYSSMSEAVDAIRYQQANYNNVPYVLLRDIDTDDDRNTSFGIVAQDEYEREGSYSEAFRVIEPATSEEISKYQRELDYETPLGMEYDGSDYEMFGD